MGSRPWGSHRGPRGHCDRSIGVAQQQRCSMRTCATPHRHRQKSHLGNAQPRPVPQKPRAPVGGRLCVLSSVLCPARRVTSAPSDRTHHAWQDTSTPIGRVLARSQRLAGDFHPDRACRAFPAAFATGSCQQRCSGQGSLSGAGNGHKRTRRAAAPARTPSTRPAAQACVNQASRPRARPPPARRRSRRRREVRRVPAAAPAERPAEPRLPRGTAVCCGARPGPRRAGPAQPGHRSRRRLADADRSFARPTRPPAASPVARHAPVRRPA